MGSGSRPQEGRRYRGVALGGTFDILHRGHRVLLTKAFEVGDFVLIGVSSDKFAKGVGKGELRNQYKARVRKLRDFIERNFPSRLYEIQPLDDYFGPGIFMELVEAIVVSEETADKAKLANELREAKGLKPLDIVLVELLMAEDGRPISATRIRRGEIDGEGRILSGLTDEAL